MFGRRTETDLSAIHRRKNLRGFTLIELLIVVAIIAILAAIAIPNFLEAQVRAKVSRVHNDMRTLATAIEAYNVDHNTYPQPCCWQHRNGDPFRLRAYVALSTPIAYLTSGIIPDPFVSKGAISGSYDPFKLTYEMAFSNEGVEARTLDNLLSSSNIMTPRSMFLVSSFGPDFSDDTDLGSFGGLDGTGRPTALARVYDPTNGTISKGDLYRCQGPAVFMQYYSTVGSRN